MKTSLNFTKRQLKGNGTAGMVGMVLGLLVLAGGVVSMVIGISSPADPAKPDPEKAVVTARFQMPEELKQDINTVYVKILIDSDTGRKYLMVKDGDSSSLTALLEKPEIQEK